LVPTSTATATVSPTATATVAPTVSIAVCNPQTSNCAVDCAGVAGGTATLDVCNICNGKITNPVDCNTVEITCVTKQATSDIIEFEKRLETQAKTLFNRFNDDVRRAKTKSCGFNLRPTTNKVREAYSSIIQQGRAIFNGYQICGNTCVTGLFANQVEALSPQFKLLEDNTRKLAAKVQRCYKQRKVRGKGTGPAGAKVVVNGVRTELGELIKDCRNKLVCP